jgi:hypothetical protein
MLTLFGAFLAAASGVALITWWARDQVRGRPATSQPDVQPGDVTGPGLCPETVRPGRSERWWWAGDGSATALPDKIDKSLVRSVPSSIDVRRKVDHQAVPAVQPNVRDPCASGG